MKKLFTISALVLISLGLSAQTSKKTDVLNQTTKVSSSKSLTATHSNTVTSPATSASMTSFYSETFSGGLSGWTASTGPGGVATGTAALWMHSTVGPTGTYAIDPVASTTAADGFLLYDSDVNCSGNQNARITSPVIDCSAHPTVKLVFQEYYRKFYDTTIVQISNDGTTWTDFVVHDGLSNNDFSGANPTIQNINISSVAGGQATVYIRFNFVSRGGGNNGCAYSWMIDDISLDEVPDNDLAIVESYDVITYMTPSNQAAAPIAFGSTLRNLGAATQSNTVLNASVLNSSSTSLFTGSANPIDLVSGIDSLAEITGTYTPSSTTGLYRTVYNVASDSVDADMTNNTDTTYFAVSDSSYSCVSGLDGSGFYLNNFTTGSLFELGYIFDVVADDTITTINTALSEGVDGTVYATIYMFDTLSSTWIPFGTTNSKVLGSSDISSTALVDVTLDFPITTLSVTASGTLKCNCIPVTPGTYAVVYSGVASTENVVIFGGTYPLNGLPVIYDAASTPPFGLVDAGIYGMVNMGDVDYTFLSDINDVDLSSSYTVSPVPANDNITVRVDLKENNSATLSIVNVLGKTISTLNIAGNGTYTMNVSDLANGIYFVNINDGNNTGSKKIVVQH